MVRRKHTASEVDAPAKKRAQSAPITETSKSEVVRVRVSGNELQQIEAAAEAADLTVSSFIRSLSLEGAGVKPFLAYEDRLVFAALAEEFRAVGVNLNQIARAINAKREVHPDEVLMALGNVLTMMGVVGFEVRELAKRGPSRRRETV
ncbi:MobC family plasmid mobilization relaxosome protein [Devosia sp. BK]|uniref:plasmid mobilization protein n=1 Tax=Devosia sp. BK TaxID=2871706 RepID=UPI00293A8F6B|nr:plasmid mobilization relaxosome protein MobC [Devosia sp. BK]MDV3253534.1 MobC family plasmid mobilization relaxosome protein [Devosia sp. BK]